MGLQVFDRLTFRVRPVLLGNPVRLFRKRLVCRWVNNVRIGCQHSSSRKNSLLSSFVYGSLADLDTFPPSFYDPCQTLTLLSMTGFDPVLIFVKPHPMQFFFRQC